MATKVLTVWRKMGVERDAMGAPDASVVFDATYDPFTGISPDDPSPLGALPKPPIADLIDSFARAFVAVEDLATVKVRWLSGVGTETKTIGQDDLPYPKDAAGTASQRNFVSYDDMNMYFVGRGPVDPARYPDGPYCQSRIEDNEYWTVYVAMIYEGVQPDPFETDCGDEDNDNDNELACPGVTWPGNARIAGRPGGGPGYSLVFSEVHRDLKAQWGWTVDQTFDVISGTTVHEVGHAFIPDHDDDGPWPNDVMSVASSEAQEARY
jgi:hypothetical protein